MDAAELRARLAARDGTVPEFPEDALAAPATSDDVAGLADGPLVAAAVLVPIVHGPTPGILLTKRTATLSSHAGQVAFPGGRIDPGEGVVEAALREAREEVGLPADLVEVTGRLPDYLTGSGFRISPVIGLLAPGFVPVPGGRGGGGGIRAAAVRAARPLGAGAAAGGVEGQGPRVLGVAAHQALHLGRHGGDPGAPGAPAARGGGLMFRLGEAFWPWRRSWRSCCCMASSTAGCRAAAPCC